jgi:3-hydroxyacyl-CoA dehydrogenase
MMRLLDRLFRMLSIRDYHDFATLYALAHGQPEKQVEEDLPALFNERAGSRGNKRLLEELREEDLSPEEVAREERESFGCPTTPSTAQRIAVARKLSVAVEIIDTFFLTDRRLWR